MSEALAFSLGLCLAMSAFAVVDWYAGRGVNGNEIWFVSLIALLWDFCYHQPMLQQIAECYGARHRPDRVLGSHANHGKKGLRPETTVALTAAMENDDSHPVYRTSGVIVLGLK